MLANEVLENEGYPENANIAIEENNNQEEEDSNKTPAYIPQNKKRRRTTEEQIIYNKLKHPLLDPCNCKKRCAQRISEDERQRLHDDFWNIDRHSQRIWLSSHVTEETAKRKCEGSKRNYTRVYHLQDNVDSTGETFKVCQKFFLGTLGYKHESVLHHMLLSTKDEHGHKKYVPSRDQRGCAVPANKKNQDAIINHINSYNPLHSHYKREHTPNRRFLPPDLDITIMHNDYLCKHPENPVSYEVYRRTISRENIGFYDTIAEKCSDCLEFDLNSKIENREQLKAEHLACANSARNQYDQDNLINDDHTSVYAADLQKVVLLPRMPDVKSSFFLSRLVTFNETFAAMGKKKKHKHYCILWHEALAGRDASDVACSFIKFLQQQRDTKTIILWMDNCSGQNKNWILYSTLVVYINQESCLTQEIILKYLVPGHTYMAADGLHGRIEQRMRKKKNVQDFDDFVSVCKESAPRIEVVPLTTSDFMQLDNKFKTRNKNSNETLPYFKDIVQAKFTKGCTGFEYKKSFSGDEDYIMVSDILKKI